MLVNPKSVSARKSGLNPYSAPVPGQSLTDEPGKLAWEKPTKFVDVNDAFRYTVNNLSDSPDVMNSFEKLMQAGVSVQEITRSITFGGFASGLWNVDVAELLQPPVAAVLALHAKENDVPFNFFVHKNRSPVEGDVNDELMLRSMKEKNPEALKKLMSDTQQEMAQTQTQLDDMEYNEGLQGFLTVNKEGEM